MRGVAGPAGRVGDFGGHVARWAERFARARDRPHGELAFVDSGHFFAIGRPDGTAAAARIDGEVGDGGVPFVVAAGCGDGQNLVGAFAKTFRIGRDHGEGDAFAVGRPGGRAGAEEGVVNFGDVAGGDIYHRKAGGAPHAVDIEEGDLLAVGGPGGAHRLGGEFGELAVLTGLEVVNPELKKVAAFVGRIDELVAIGRPGGVGV